MRFLLFATAALAAAPVGAQDHSAHGSHQHGTEPEQSEPDTEVDHCAMGHLPPEKCPPKNEADPPESTDHSQHGEKGQTEHSEMAHGGMDHAEMDHSQHQQGAETDEGGMDHSQMDHSQMDHSAHGGSVDKSAPGAAPETAVPDRAFDGPRHAADAIWGENAMAPSRRNLARENGGMRTGMVMLERIEARIAADSGEDGYLWDAQAFYGGDINRFVLKTEGEGEFGGELEEAEIQALYSRAIGPFFDFQAGVRFDPEPDTRGHLVVGIQGLAPYMFKIDSALFLSDRGDLTARIEGEYDQRITQQLILQPRIEIELAAQDIPEREIGAGVTSIEPGLRLRYEFQPEFAPYIGIEYEVALGETADIARASGEDPDRLKILVGLRAWF
ncbi:copper resistance protein B [Erythrobacter rubeus]|uniref:Copper resistance protein B n=1 Tax=Erythrobacter rubeus TaxID=2760803 RepID=A0ABR8KNZ5_9SPHN|nr:copper resistance protein B [Erythrobacter rubeus]MBD2840965.1 copper resistance protein B [Erythrobacter rubeus]